MASGTTGPTSSPSRTEASCVATCSSSIGDRTKCGSLARDPQMVERLGTWNTISRTCASRLGEWEVTGGLGAVACLCSLDAVEVNAVLLNPELAIRPSPAHRLAPQQSQPRRFGDPAYRRRFCLLACVAHAPD